MTKFTPLSLVFGYFCAVFFVNDVHLNVFATNWADIWLYIYVFFWPLALLIHFFFSIVLPIAILIAFIYCMCKIVDMISYKRMLRARLLRKRNL